MGTKHSDEYSEREAQQRFEKLVKAALNTPPKPRKSMTPKRYGALSKKRAHPAKLKRGVGK